MPLQIQILDIANIPSLQIVVGVTSADAQAFELHPIPELRRRYVVRVNGSGIEPGIYVFKLAPDMGVEIVSNTVEVTAEQAKQFFADADLRGPAYSKFVVRFVKVVDPSVPSVPAKPTKKRVGKRRK